MIISFNKIIILIAFRFNKKMVILMNLIIIIDEGCVVVGSFR